MISIIQHSVQNWVDSCGGVDNECEMWTEDEIIAGDGDLVKEACPVEINYSPESTDTSNDDIFSYIDDCDDSSATESGRSESILDLQSVPDLTVIGVDDDEVGVDESLVEELAIDNGDEPTTYSFAAITLANIGLTLEMELYDSGASCHMSPYRHSFINFIPIQRKILTAADGGCFEATGKGDMRISMPVGKSAMKIFLKDVLYAPKMGVTLISIRKIDAAGYVVLFHKNQLQIFSSMKERKLLAQIPMVNGLYWVEHQDDVDLAVAVDPEVVSIEKLHRLMGHIAPEAAKTLVEKGLVEGFKLDTSSQMPKSCDTCEYGKAHRKPIKKECKAPKAAKIGDEVHSDVWGPSPVQMMGSREYYSTFTDDYLRFTKLYLQRLKSKNFQSYKQYEAFLLRQKGAHIKKL